MERLHKFMAHCGIASRRQAEDYIREGRVTVNGVVVAELGVKIDPVKDVIMVDGKTLHPEKKVCYLLHKPRGYATTVEDDLGRKTVMDLLPEVKERIYPAGRLDFDSEGLIILTNDGDAAYFLTHPSYGVRKVYEALVEGEVEDSTITTLLDKGVYLGAMRIKPIMAKIVKRQNDSTIVRVIVAEGVNREVRRLFAALGHEVKRLVRLEVGPFRIDGIARGKYRLATPQEIAALHESMETASKHPSSASAKQAKKKYGPPAPRPGKPDPALYGNRERPRRAPLILKHKTPDRSNDDINEYEDDNYFDNAIAGQRKNDSQSRFSRASNRKRSDVSYETFKKPFGKPTLKGRQDRNLKRDGNRFEEKGDWKNRRKRPQFSRGVEDDFSFNDYDSRQIKQRHGVTPRNRTSMEFPQRHDHNHEEYTTRRHDASRRFGDENYSSSFRRPPTRFSDNDKNEQFGERKKSHWDGEGNRHHHMIKGQGNFDKSQGFHGKPNRGKDDFHHYEKKQQNHGNGKPHTGAPNKVFKKNKGGKPAGHKPARHPLDR